MHKNPIVTTRGLEAGLSAPRSAAGRLLRQFEDAGVLEDTAQEARSRGPYAVRELTNLVTADELGLRP